MSQAGVNPQGTAGYLNTVQGQLWRWDLKSLVGSVLLGVVLTVVGSLAERIDAGLTGGAFVIMGAINFVTFCALSTLLFRLPGGIITGLINAFIAVATASSPMSPWFIPTNALFALIFALLIWKLPMDKWWHYFVSILVAHALDMVIILCGLLVTIKLPLNIALVSYLVATLAGAIGGTIFAMAIAKAVEKSRVLQ